MKRVRVSSKKFVTISAEMVDKAARVFSTTLTPEQIRAFKSPEPVRVARPMLGSTKPLVLSKPVVRVEGRSGAVVAVVHRSACAASKSPAPTSQSESLRKVTAAGALRRKTG
ncbi:hypothetical protein PV762_07475 [Mitsuaria sp. CC2]|uniref:hypothetical protein n=1 Tax=Mitsuaria sp. CC2 TaxID=3029186 RepID=UPI003B8E80E0